MHILPPQLGKLALGLQNLELSETRRKHELQRTGFGSRGFLDKLSGYPQSVGENFGVAWQWSPGPLKLPWRVFVAILWVFGRLWAVPWASFGWCGNGTVFDSRRCTDKFELEIECPADALNSCSAAFFFVPRMSENRQVEHTWQTSGDRGDAAS